VRDRWRRAAAEAIGAFFLVLIGAGAAMVNAAIGGGIGVTGIALAFAFVIVAMVYALGHLSGAHLNPAVTVAFWSVRRFPGRDVGPYVVAQCSGAIAAASVLRVLLGPVGHMGATLPALAPHIPVAGAFLIEWLLSFALMLVIMAVATDDRVPPGFAPIAVGLTVGFCALTGGPLTGASMNPARSFGPALIGGEWRAHWVYWVAPITAMVVAAQVYDALRLTAAPRAKTDHTVIGLEGPVGEPTANGGDGLASVTR
jgi:MIP family channel proteins